MRKARFTEHQIIAVIKSVEAGRTVKELARARGKDFVWLEVLEQNERACNFYRKQGMTLIKSGYFKTTSQQSVIRIMGIAV